MKWYLGWMIKLHYRRVYSAGFDNTPDGEPAIFASNHPSGFTEPIILGTHVRQPMNFLVLGSYLRSKWLQWFFRGVKMVPIYRRDITGNQTIEKNKSTFLFVHNALKHNAHILIYPEAKTHFMYKIRPLRKGIVRMAWGFLNEKTHEAMYIVPVGVNFIWPSRFRSDVFIQLGEPIRLDKTNGDEQVWYRDKLALVAEGMKKLMFDVHDESRHATVQNLVQMYHNDHITRAEVLVKAYKTADQYVQKIRDFVNRIDLMDDLSFGSVSELLEDYNRQLEQRKLKDVVVKKTYKLGAQAWTLLIIGFPFFLMGAVLNGFSLLAAYWVKRNLVKRTEYKAAVSSAIPTVLTLTFVIVFIILGIFLHYAFFGLAVLFPLTLYLFIYYLDIIVLFIQRYKWHKLALKEKEILIALRRKILDMIE